MLHLFHGLSDLWGLDSHKFDVFNKCWEWVVLWKKGGEILSGAIWEVSAEVRVFKPKIEERGDNVEKTEMSGLSFTQILKAGQLSQR